MHIEDRRASSFTSKRHVCEPNSSKFVLWLVCGVFVSTGTAVIVSVWTPAAAEHFKPTSSLADISLCARARRVQQKEGWSERLNWREARKEPGKGDKGGQLPEHNYCSNNLHPSPASSLSNGPKPHIRDRLSRQVGQTLCHPKEAPPCTEWKSEAAFWTTFPSLPCVLLVPFCSHTSPTPATSGWRWAGPRSTSPPRLRRGWIKVQARQAGRYLNSSQSEALQATCCQNFQGLKSCQCTFRKKMGAQTKWLTAIKK